MPRRLRAPPPRDHERPRRSRFPGSRIVLQRTLPGAGALARRRSPVVASAFVPGHSGGGRAGFAWEIAEIGATHTHRTSLLAGASAPRRGGLDLVRAATVGTDPRFVRMIRELVLEQQEPDADRPALGEVGPSHRICPVGCCRAGRTGLPGGPAVAAS